MINLLFYLVFFTVNAAEKQMTKSSVEPLGPHCRPFQYTYHADYGFGYYIKPGSIHSPGSCVMYGFRDHNYPPFPPNESTTTDKCINSSECVHLGGKEGGQTLVRLLCPPFRLHGQNVVALHQEPSQKNVKILIRSNEPVRTTFQSQRQYHEEVVKSSRYVEQEISKNFIMTDGLRDKAIVDLLDNPQEIYNKDRNKVSGVYMTGACDPQSSEPPPWIPEDKTEKPTKVLDKVKSQGAM